MQPMQRVTTVSLYLLKDLEYRGAHVRLDLLLVITVFVRAGFLDREGDRTTPHVVFEVLIIVFVCLYLNRRP